uniref:GH16 domain-containing protein n=1 Tax=Kwoniella pini CBS 10737 TaxID=1296096 RepID=A0A1B9HZ03_9TREE|nr:uncharacterized protein I206_05240 [Kwoniella pini CBS 10737]OCF48461.1 hypothetical protein I206_05240 [Kwoniella pini CBS 10737]
MLLVTILISIFTVLAIATPLNPRATSCSCGYVLTKYNNVYFPKSLTVSFDKVNSLSALQAAGFEINTGWQMGTSAEDGGYALGSSKNIGFKDGYLTLTVPGGQKKGKSITGAEISTKTIFGGGIFTMNAQLSKVPGTVQSMFSYTSNYEKFGDEQDIELLASSFLTANPDNGTPPGIELTNYAPDNSGNNEETIVPFPNNPTEGFNNYTIGWIKGGTQYYYNGKAINSPKKYSSINPSYIILNNWSSGDPNFSMGPPAQDSVLKGTSRDSLNH